jgi:hypothetical protein
MARRSVQPIASILLEFIAMSTTRTLFVSVLFASAALAASAQTPPVASASMPMGGAAMPRDCTQPLAKHDHGAEKGMPRAMSKTGPCAAGAAAMAPEGAASAAPAKQLPKHNHGAEKNN